ncbi:hypothetical protein [Bacillus xiapuensis]|uniref:Uncharacterized protein n=1 Tax=Bacillus xiapuensis TaxID=2014075 RepID=A0ABU6N803_9BACI|nr:hypothetical protein [Bacillus xiapuensis]
MAKHIISIQQNISYSKEIEVNSEEELKLVVDFIHRFLKFSSPKFLSVDLEHYKTEIINLDEE